MIIGIFLSYTQNVGFDVRKKMYKLPEMGGGEVIRAMPERKHSFFQEVFPYSKVSRNRKTTISLEKIIIFNIGIFSFLLFLDTFRIQGIWSFLLFPDTFGKGWKVRSLEGW